MLSTITFSVRNSPELFLPIHTNRPSVGRKVHGHHSYFLPISGIPVLMVRREILSSLFFSSHSSRFSSHGQNFRPRLSISLFPQPPPLAPWAELPPTPLHLPLPTTATSYSMGRTPDRTPPFPSTHNRHFPPRRQNFCPFSSISLFP